MLLSHIYVAAALVMPTLVSAFKVAPPPDSYQPPAPGSYQPSPPGSYQPSPPAPGPAPGPKVIFNDDFNTAPLNLTQWDYDLGDGSQFGIPGWGNQELELYDKTSAESGVGGQYLRITARRTGAESWSSAKIKTSGRFSFKYGRVDVRARLPVVDGAFPAIWMMPQNNTYGIWPNSGEADIVEYQSMWRTKFQPERFRTPGSLHYGAAFGANATSFWAEGNDPSQWHTYSLIWTENDISFKLDGSTYGSHSRPQNANSTQWPFDQEFYLIINLAVQPGWSKPKPVPKNVNEFTMDVDWIKVTSDPKSEWSYQGVKAKA